MVKGVIRIIIVTLLTIAIFFALTLSNYNYSFALSPSFPRQYIGEPPYADWQAYALTSRANCSAVADINFPQIEAITYVSDGRFLNATLWLDGPFNERIPVDNNFLIQMGGYFMAVKVVSTYRSEGFDYMLTVDSGSHTTRWIRDLKELSSNDSRSLEDPDINPIGFFDNSPGNPALREKGKGHVNLSLDLEKINFPQQYIVLFGTTFGRIDLLRGGCIFADLADTVAYAPPPEFAALILPNPVIMRADEEKTITLTVNSSISVPSSLIANLSLNASAPKGLELSVVPNEQPMNLPGITTSYVTARAQTNPPSGQSHVVSVMAEISFPKIHLALGGLIPAGVPAGLLGIGGNATNQDPIVTATINPMYNFKVDVLPSLTFEERFADFWTVWGPLITFIGGGFAAGGAKLFFDKIKKSDTSKEKDEPHNQPIGNN